MEQYIQVNQTNKKGKNTVAISYPVLSPDWLCSYDKELKIDRKRKLLYEATDGLIGQNKVFRSPDVEKVKVFLNSNNVCLVKAPEGRGKTFLSRIVAFDFRKEKKKVFFADFSKIVDNDQDSNKKNFIEQIKHLLETWKKDKKTKYLLVLENVHACLKLPELLDIIEDWRCEGMEADKGNVQFLLNARPIDEGVNYFEEWNEVVELKPERNAIDRIVGIYTEETNGRQPFENDDSKEAFVKIICSNGIAERGTNLRLLSYYLKTWLDDETIQYVSDIGEEKIIGKIKAYYSVDQIDADDLLLLLYFSSIFQFDVPLHRDIINHSKVFENDATPNKNTDRLSKFLNKPYGMLCIKKGRYYMFHSFDAYVLCKAICDYRGDDYAKVTQLFIETFLNAILNSGKPCDFEKEFTALLSGIIAKKDELKNVVYLLTSEDFAKDIITKLNPGFVSFFFRPENHRTYNPNALLKYYNENADWMKLAMFRLEPGYLAYINNTIFKKYLIHDLFGDIFADTEDLEKYLENYEKVFYGSRVLIAICDLGEKYKEVLKKRYEEKKGTLKEVFLGMTPTKLNFVMKAYKNCLKINIVEDIFVGIIDLENYLRENEIIYQHPNVLIAICELGINYRNALKQYYIHNITHLKPYFLESNPELLTFEYRTCKKYFGVDILSDVFEDFSDLDVYLKKNGKERFQQVSVLRAIEHIGIDHQLVLERHKAFDHLFSTTPRGCRISQEYIHRFWDSKNTFDIGRIKNNSFYLDRVRLKDLNRFILIIKKNMTEENEMQSIEMVKNIVRIVLKKVEGLSNAVSRDLFYFYYNVKIVDENVFRKLMDEECVRIDIIRRLSNPSYTSGDLDLFDLFFSKPWCKNILETRIIGADNNQRKTIKEWHDNLMGKRGNKEIASGTLFEYIHCRWQ